MKQAMRADVSLSTLIVLLILVLSSPETVMAEQNPQTNETAMALHHLQATFLNHGLGMAEKASDLILLGEMGMAPIEDNEDIQDGEKMIVNARTLWTYLLEGPPMQHLMQMVLVSTRTEESEVMARTHKLGKAGEEILNMLATIPND